MKRILLLTDFSDNALEAMHYALHFFKAQACEFYVLHVHKVKSYISDDLMAAPNASIHDSITIKPKEKLEALINTFRSDFNNSQHTFEALIDFDVFEDAVNQVVSKHEIDYVVMGTNGITGANEVLFGSNTLNVIRKVDCTTIIIPEAYKFKPLNSFLLSLQPEDSLNDAPFKEVMDFIKTHKLQLHVLRMGIGGEVSEIARFDKQKLAIINCKYELAEDIPIAEAVSAYLNTHDIDMMAATIHKQSFLERLFNKSQTESINENLQIPLLVLHDH
ncbi:universal stress protein [Subsaximicrobium wynnwilliamsii]|uniref:Universal stress protein n=1 Tax=Subsaximicrobium wynnwilliamsii TaxID=291179 RepID=A0A5C6ZGH5_9FLAO|nr:universal stress protein [Subsaximicrobium wynnwilliamsii]TXD83068.1 universal stress protein [Subsaximicrobium wynnwilliamsii]TXD88812.1 universal stress protein [Subsaximicrobium wynnwilliamsii]TXE02885.1 universal stress protein [Subsaximicrobium wynnwilliamsii]